MRKDFRIERNGVVLKGYCWEPEIEPIASLVLVHGMAETIERYDEFASFLSERGFVVFGINQRGHGPEAEALGYLGENGILNMMEDLKEVVDKVRAAHLSLPLFLFGHSMGSFITRLFLVDYANLIQGAVISGTGVFGRMQLFFGRLVAAMHVRRHGPKSPSMLLHNLAFSSFDKAFEREEGFIPNSWLSRDKQKVAEYNQDPLCGQIHPASFYFDLFSALHILQYRLPIRSKGLPLLFLSGDRDPLGGKKGTQVSSLREKYLRGGYRADLLLYPGGRHEMLNEINRPEVYADIYAWLKEGIDGQSN